MIHNGSLDITGRLSSRWLDLTTGLSAPTHTEGRMFYDTVNKTFTLYNDDTTLSLPIGQQIRVKVFNNTGVSIPAGKVVSIDGVDGSGFGYIVLTDVTDSDLRKQTAGLVIADIADSAYGYILLQGILQNVDTSAISAGAPVWGSITEPGGLQNSEPVTNVVSIGTILSSHATTGSMLVNIKITSDGAGLWQVEASPDMPYPSYNGPRFAPTEVVNGLIISANVNEGTGYAITNENTGNAAYAGIDLTTDVSGNIGGGIYSFGANYFVSRLQTTTAMWSTTSFEIVTARTGTEFRVRLGNKVTDSFDDADTDEVFKIETDFQTSFPELTTALINTKGDQSAVHKKYVDDAVTTATQNLQEVTAEGNSTTYSIDVQGMTVNRSGDGLHTVFSKGGVQKLAFGTLAGGYPYIQGSNGHFYITATGTGTSNLILTADQWVNINRPISTMSNATIDSIGNYSLITKDYLTTYYTAIADAITDHVDLSNIGTNTHAQIDTHIADTTVHFTEGSIDHGSISGLADDDHTQYHTDGRALTWLGTRSTTDLSEGTNLYYTDARVEAHADTLYSVLAHTHLLAAGATDVTATAAELNLLDLSGLSTNWILSSDSSTTASWKSAASVIDTLYSANGAISDARVIQLGSVGSLEILKSDALATLTIRGGLNTQLAIGNEISSLDFASNDASPKTPNDVTGRIVSKSGDTSGQLAGLSFHVLKAGSPYIYEGMYLSTAANLSVVGNITGANLSGTNTGNQTSIVGITGTKAQFDTAVTDGNIMYIGDAPTSHTHTFASLTSKPTTVAGYGITDAYTKTEADGKYLLNTTDTFTGDLSITGNIISDGEVRTAGSPTSQGYVWTDYQEITIASLETEGWYKLINVGTAAIRGFTLKIMAAGDNGNSTDIFQIITGGYNFQHDVIALTPSRYNTSKILEVRTDNPSSGGTAQVWVRIAGYTTTDTIEFWTTYGTFEAPIVKGVEPTWGGKNVSLTFDSYIRDDNSIMATGNIFAAGFEGDGSLLTSVDADTLNSYADTQFLRGDATATKSVGNLNFDDNIKLQFGTGYDSAIRFQGSSTIWNLVAGNFYFQDNNSTRFTFERATGNFTAIGSGVFGASGNARITDDVNGARIGKADNTSYIYYQATTGQSFYTNSVETMRLNNSGNLGLGTTSPVAKLEVKNNVANSWACLVNSSDGGRLAGIYEEADTRATFAFYNASNAQTVRLDTNGNSYFNGGNVGIGTTSPSVAADVVGDIKASGTIQTGVYTVAGLPTGSQGVRAFVTDATATTFLSTVAGGGANKVPVVHDGTNWVIG